jgi:hypothetical protein
VDKSEHTPSRRLLILSSLTIIGTVLLLFGWWPVTGGDLFMHLTVGRWTWQHSSPPMVDVFSYLTPNAPFIAHSWLAGLVFYGLDSVAGVVGFAMLRFTLISAALLCTVRTARLMGAEWSAIYLLAPVVLAIMWARLEFRPQLFTSAFLACQLWLVVSVHLGTRDWRWLWVLPPMYALWINLHAGFVQGMAMLGVVGVALGAMELRRRWLAHLSQNCGKGRGRKTVPQNSAEVLTTSHLPLQHLALVMAACGLALFINPYGSRLIVFPFAMQAEWIHKVGSEWQSPVGNTNWRRVGGGISVPVAPVFWCYITALGTVLLVHVRRWRSTDLVSVAVMGLWVMMSLRHIRAVSDAALLTAPFIAAALPSAKFCTGAVWCQRIGVGLTLVIALLSLPIRHDYLQGYERGASVAGCVRAMIEHHGLSGRVYSNEVNHWLLYWFHPRVVVDFTWEYVAGPKRTAESEALASKDFPAYLVRHRVDAVVLTDYKTMGMRKDLQLNAVRNLVERGWSVVHLNGTAVILVPNRPDTARLIEQEGYYWLNVPGHEPSTPADFLAVLEEANRALRHCPSAYFAWPLKAFALRMLGFHDEADAADRTARRMLDAMSVR